MTTSQVKPQRGGNLNPTGKGGFRDNPQNIYPGGWKKEESIGYQYQRIIRMSPEERKKFTPETTAQEIALKQVKEALNNNGLPSAKEITDRTEGKAPQSIDVTTGGEKLNVALVEFVDGTENQSSDTK
jgi:hypothetical protein